MKTITKIIIIFIISFIVTACGTMPDILSEKYNFDDFLVEVKEIENFRLDGWGNIDNQALILHAGPSRDYLIVLRRPVYNINSIENIGISNIGGRVSSGDTIVVGDSYSQDSYIIQKIYELEDRQQTKQIKKQLH